MTPDDLADAARRLYGPGKGAFRALATALGVRHQSLTDVLRGRAVMPEGWPAEVQLLLAAAGTGGVCGPAGGTSCEEDVRP